MNEGYGFIKFGKRNEYYGENLSLFEISKFVFLNKRIFLQTFRIDCQRFSIRWLIEFFKFKIKIFWRNLFHLFRFIKFKLNIKSPDEILFFEFAGEYCKLVNQGYKIFNFKNGIVRKVFQKDICSETVEKEIRLLISAQNTNVSAKLIRWDLSEKWYEEELIKGQRDFSHFPRETDEFLQYFTKYIVPVLNKILHSSQIVPRKIEKIFNSYYQNFDAKINQNKHIHSEVKLETGKFLMIQANVLKNFNDSIIYLAFSHGDFCPANIINTSKGVKIIDWESAGTRSLLFDFFSYVFFRPAHQKLRNFSILDSEIGIALDSFSRSFNSELAKEKTNVDSDHYLYRHIFYVERIMMLIDRAKKDKKLNINNIIINYINAFNDYDAHTNTRLMA